MGSTIFVWIPTLKDSIIPFILGATELLLIRSINLDLQAWFFTMAFMSFSGMIAFINMRRSAAREEDDNEGILNALKRYAWLNPVWCASYSVSFTIFGAIVSTVKPSIHINLIFASLSLIMVLAFLGRATLYWHQALHYVREDKL